MPERLDIAIHNMSDKRTKNMTVEGIDVGKITFATKNANKINAFPDKRVVTIALPQYSLNKSLFLETFLMRISPLPKVAKGCTTTANALTPINMPRFSLPRDRAIRIKYAACIKIPIALPDIIHKVARNNLC